MSRPFDPVRVALSLSDVRFSWRAGKGKGKSGKSVRDSRDKNPGGSPAVFSLALGTLDVPAGSTILLLGPSGSGKSTLLSLICGLVRADQGRIVVAGQDVTRMPTHRRDRFRANHFGIIFQLFNLLPYGSVMDNVLLPLHFAKERRARVLAHGSLQEEARRLLDRLGLDESHDTQTAVSLSVGQQQRVAAARAFIGRPDIIVADEPTSALDQDRRQAFLELLFEQRAQSGSTLLMVSHDETLAPAFDQVVSLPALLQKEEGRL